ncbi:MAG: hypothetical protein EOP87_16610, partial [Verrucomicrobiaceae bacterium]
MDALRVRDESVDRASGTGPDRAHERILQKQQPAAFLPRRPAAGPVSPAHLHRLTRSLLLQESRKKRMSQYLPVDPCGFPLQLLLHPASASPCGGRIVNHRALRPQIKAIPEMAGIPYCQGAPAPVPEAVSGPFPSPNSRRHKALEMFYRTASGLDSGGKSLFMDSPPRWPTGRAPCSISRTHPYHPMTLVRFPARLLLTVCLLPLASCSYMSQVGPQKGAFDANSSDYRVIEVKSRADIPTPRRSYGASEIPTPVKGGSYSDKIRTRDSLHFFITDLNPQSPFAANGKPSEIGPIEVPEDGKVSIPYVGELQVMSRTLSQISADLNEKLKPISNTAQGSVSRSGRISRTANVIGEVNRPGPVPLEKSNITSLDLLAASGGPPEAEHLYKYTLRRNGRDYVFDYQGFRKNAFPVEEGDLLSVTTDMSNRFYVMGAINKPTTVPFPVPTPTLADALGATSGFDERR